MGLLSGFAGVFAELFLAHARVSLLARPLAGQVSAHESLLASRLRRHLIPHWCSRSGFPPALGDDCRQARVASGGLAAGGAGDEDVLHRLVGLKVPALDAAVVVVRHLLVPDMNPVNHRVVLAA